MDSSSRRGIKRTEPGQSLADILWLQDDNKDVIIDVDGKQIKAHAFILTNKYKYFNAALNGRFKEAVEKIVKIEDFSFEVVEIAIRYAYERDINVNHDNAAKLLQFSDKYEMKALQEVVEDFLIENLKDQNIAVIANDAFLYNADRLKKSCLEILMKMRGSMPYDIFETLSGDVWKAIGCEFFKASQNGATVGSSPASGVETSPSVINID